MDTPRVLINDLEYPGDGLHYLRGESFTGVAETRDGRYGRLAGESEFRDGLEWGSARFWYPSGQLRRETESAWGACHGTVREWDETGRLVREATYQYGVMTYEKHYGSPEELPREYHASADAWEMVRLYREAFESPSEPAA